MTRQRVGGVLRVRRPQVKPAALLDVLSDIGDLAWLACERQDLRQDFDEIARKYPERLESVGGRLRWRR